MRIEVVERRDETRETRPGEVGVVLCCGAVLWSCAVVSSKQLFTNTLHYSNQAVNSAINEWIKLGFNALCTHH
jgi:hypothetical protein